MSATRSPSRPVLPCRHRVTWSPTTTLTTATPLAGGFAISGDLLDTQDTYRWTTTELASGRGWDLRFQGPVSDYVTVYLQGPDGSAITSVSTDKLGIAELADLRLPAGDHILQVYPSWTVSTPYSLSATEVDLAGADPEPNGAPTRPCRSTRHIRWSTDASPRATARTGTRSTSMMRLAAALLDVRLIWRTGPPDGCASRMRPASSSSAGPATAASRCRGCTCRRACSRWR